MSFESDGYVKVEKLLTKDICKIAERYFLYDRFNSPQIIGDRRVRGSHSKYADSLTESMLLFLKPEIEKQTNLKLIPTYSYFRIYKPGDVLKPHTDRNSCEISVTLTIGYKHEMKCNWPLYFCIGDKNHYIASEIGDGVIYKGCKLTHGRNEFDTNEGSYQIQVFLHYIDAANKNAQILKYDGRSGIGEKKRK